MKKEIKQIINNCKKELDIASIKYVDKEGNEQVFEYTIKPRLEYAEYVEAIAYAMNKCTDVETGEFYPPNLRLAVDMTLLKYYTDFGAKMTEGDLAQFADTFRGAISNMVAQAAAKNNVYDLIDDIYAEAEWHKQIALAHIGVNETFVKLNEVLDSVGKLAEGFSAQMENGDFNIEQILKAVETMKENPDKMTEAVIDFEKAKIAVKDDDE